MSEAYHPQKGAFIRELQEGERFIGYYVLRNKQLEPFRDPSRGYFLTLILSDRTGQLMGRVWEGAEEANEELQQGDVVKLDGEVETYLDRMQIRVHRVRPANSGEYDLRDMLPSTRRDPEAMQEQLRFFIEGVENRHLSALLAVFFDDAKFMQSFSQAPAARRIHHAYIGGLLEHTLETLAMAQTVIELYPQIDTDLLLTGLLLHDIGKVREFTWETDIDYSDEGRLIGHIVMTDEMVTEALTRLPEFPAELALRLRHMLLAHHGRYEWGSPRRPKTLEAIALHHIENLSVQINRFHLLLEERPPGENWTNYDRMLGRYLYAGGDSDLNVEEQGWTE